MKYSVLIMAAGSGRRAELPYNKILHKIHNKSVLEYSLDFFNKEQDCDQIIVICNAEDLASLKRNFNNYQCDFIIGGNTRQESVINGLYEVNNDYVLIHDAARPFINRAVVRRLLSMLAKHPACSIAVPAKNTMVKVDGNRYVEGIDRNRIMQVQTPQAFETRLIIKAHKAAQANNFEATDDTSLIAEFTDVIPRYVIGDERSIKLTTPYDIKLLEVIL